MFISEEGTNSPFNVELFKDFQQLVLQAQISFFFAKTQKAIQRILQDCNFKLFQLLSHIGLLCIWSLC